jgi:hypothetical protein
MTRRDEPGDHALGRSRGGLSTKIHAAVDGRGRPLAILLNPAALKAMIDTGGRNVIERAFNGFKHWRGLATRYDKHATVYRGALVLAAALLWINDLGVSSPACSVSCMRLASFA